MSTSFNRKDIEEFWRRSNSICDNQKTRLDVQNDIDDVNQGPVQVRRMSLAEFTGLDGIHRQCDTADFGRTPSWRCGSVSPSTLLAASSKRRRSAFANVSVSSIETPRNGDDIDIAIERIRNLKNIPQDSADDVQSEKESAMSSLKRLSSDGEKSLSSIIETCTDINRTIRRVCTATTSVFHRQLLLAELDQLFQAIVNRLEELRKRRAPSTSHRLNCESKVLAKLISLQRVLETMSK